MPAHGRCILYLLIAAEIIQPEDCEEQNVMMVN